MFDFNVGVKRRITFVALTAAALVRPWNFLEIWLERNARIF
jgi:hypothetical protein